MQQLQREVGTAYSALVAHAKVRFVPNPSDIFRDLLALKQEFDEVEIDPNRHTVAVITDAIVLEDVELGRFKVQLDWEDLDSAYPYRVIALDPKPAITDSRITHPHVSGERLCEGDGRLAIKAALTQGRLYDFFVLVSQILHTYGSSSPYVRLEEWTGKPCSGCGSSTSEKDRYFCRQCDDVLCNRCIACCPGCEEIFCYGCVLTCSGCGRELCRTCLRTCARCGSRVCGKCLQDGLCGTCHEHQQSRNDDDETSRDLSEATAECETGPGTAADAHRLGEALVPA
jgi:hypothetical protein